MRMLTWVNTGKKTQVICEGDIGSSEHCSVQKVQQIPQYCKKIAKCYNTSIPLSINEVNYRLPSSYFRRIYPEGNEEKYAIFFENSCSLFQETAASKARIECAR